MIYKIYKKEAMVTLMGVDNKHFKPYKRNRLKSKFKNKILITHSTDYSEMKKTDLAIIAISRLAKKFNNILLLITSTQPDNSNKIRYADSVKKFNLENNVKFLDFVPYRQLPLYYSMSLCYLSCSDDEMLGTTSSNLPVKEAMSCGVPAIRAPVTNEDVEDGVSGFLVDPKDTDLICKKIIYLINNPNVAKKMGAEGRKKIMKLYTWEKVANKIIHYV